MDIFTPKHPAKGAAIVFIVSGGWNSARRMINPRLFHEFLTRGYGVYAVMHRHQSKTTIPRILNNLNKALVFISENAQSHGFDQSLFGFCGISSGGHLALMLALNEATKIRPKAVACFYPPTDFLNYGKTGADVFSTGLLDRFKRVFASPSSNVTNHPKSKQQVLKFLSSISPITHVTPDDPPTFLIHGDADELVPLQQSKAIAKKFEANKVRYKLHIKGGKAHGWQNQSTDMKYLADWFDMFLSSKP